MQTVTSVPAATKKQRNSQPRNGRRKVFNFLIAHCFVLSTNDFFVKGIAENLYAVLLWQYFAWLI